MTIVASGVVAVVLAVVHLLARRFEEQLSALPRNRWLSIAGGISIAYVFVHLLPEVAAVQQQLEEAEVTVPWLERHGWLAALAGLVVFYGLEQHARRSRDDAADDETRDAVGWIHVASYAAYNGIAGYVLRSKAEMGVGSLALFAFAIGVHFLVNDASLVEEHGRLYRRRGRWLVAAGVIAGWALSAVVHLHEAAITVLVAFLSGAIVLTVLKEELPDERKSRFGSFLAATTGYAALLVAL